MNSCERIRHGWRHAVRTAISPRRVTVRAYRRIARFTATTNASAPTSNCAARRSHTIVGSLISTCSRVNGATIGRKASRPSGCSSTIARPADASSASACASVASGFNRANTWSSGPCHGRFVEDPAEAASRTGGRSERRSRQASRRRWCEALRRSESCPTMCGSALKRSRHGSCRSPRRAARRSPRQNAAGSGRRAAASARCRTPTR